MQYAELQITTPFTFLTGASHAEEVVQAAVALGYRAVGVADRNTLAGVVRMHLACRDAGIRLVVGARLDLTDGPSLLAYPTDRAAYGRLSRLLTLGRRRAPKGACHIGRADVEAHAEGLILVAVPPDPDGLPDGAGGDPARFEADLADYRARFGPGLRLAATHRYRGDDAKRLARLADLAGRQGLALVATNDVHHHAPDRRPLADVMTCIREKTTIHAAGWRLAANAERHLKAPGEIARLFRRWPDAVAEAGRIAEASVFLAGPSSASSTHDEWSKGDATPRRRAGRLTAGGRQPSAPHPRRGCRPGLDPETSEPTTLALIRPSWAHADLMF